MTDPESPLGPVPVTMVVGYAADGTPIRGRIRCRQRPDEQWDSVPTVSEARLESIERSLGMLASRIPSNDKGMLLFTAQIGELAGQLPKIAAKQATLAARCRKASETCSGLIKRLPDVVPHVGELPRRPPAARSPSQGAPCDVNHPAGQQRGQDGGIGGSCARF